jgi:hypothetical protein
MTTTAIIVHQMEGRMRLRVPDMRGDVAFFQEASESLEALEDIFSVTTRPLTGSILIEYDGMTVDTLQQWARKQQLFEISEPDQLRHEGSSIAQITQYQMNRIDDMLKQGSEGRFDLLSLLMMMSVGLLINEFLNGRLAAGSFALVWYALDAAGINKIRQKTGF